jgi:hypothetical protein
MVEQIMENNTQPINALKLQSRLRELNDSEIAGEQEQAANVTQFVEALRSALGTGVTVHAFNDQTKWSFPIFGIAGAGCYGTRLEIIWEYGPYWDLVCMFEPYDTKNSSVAVSAYTVLEAYNAIRAAMEIVAPDIRPFNQAVTQENMCHLLRAKLFRTGTARSK